MNRRGRDRYAIVVAVAFVVGCGPGRSSGATNAPSSNTRLFSVDQQSSRIGYATATYTIRLPDEFETSHSGKWKSAQSILQIEVLALTEALQKERQDVLLLTEQKPFPRNLFSRGKWIGQIEKMPLGWFYHMSDGTHFIVVTAGWVPSGGEEAKTKAVAAAEMAIETIEIR